MSLFIFLQNLETAGDKVKFAEIYMRHRHRMYCVAFRVLQDSSDAEDAVQATFEYFARNYETYRTYSKERLVGNLMIAVEHRAINIKKSKSRFVLTDSEDLAYYDIQLDTGYETPLPEDGPVSKALQEISPHFRRIILLRYGQEMKTREIAELLGMKMDTLQKQLKRAKQALGELIKEQQELERQNDKEIS